MAIAAGGLRIRQKTRIIYSMDYNDQPVTAETLAANRRFDSEHHTVCMDPGVPLRTRSVITAVKGLLTDKQIQKYEEAGYYSMAFREARKEFWERRTTKAKMRQEKRDGNFLIQADGRRVYSPL